MSQLEKRELVNALASLKDIKHDTELFHESRDALVFGEFFQMILRKEQPLSHKDIIAIVKKIEKANREGPDDLWYA